MRIGQVWFYDDGTRVINVRLRFCQVNPRIVYYKTNPYVVGGENTPDTGAYTYTNAWAALGLDESIHASVIKDTENGFYYYGAIGAAENGKNYTYHNDKKDSGVARTKGWHQATAILEEDGIVNTYLDGVLIGSEKCSKSNGAGGTLYAGGESAGYFDDMVMVANPNTTKPTVNIAVSYDETQGSVLCNNNVVANGGKAEAYYDDSVNFTFEPKAGFKLDSVSYDGINVTDFIKNGVLNVDCKNAELVVTFKEIPVEAPSVSKTMEIETDQKVDGNPAALMYMQIQPGYGYTVTDTGIVISNKENNAENGLKLVALTENKTNVTSGMFGIRVYGDALTGTKCYYRPFITYQKDGQNQTDYSDTEESFTLTK
ncbi:MAG: hypothetical protein E7399_06000 [Ruminococcaceae bacterium]|nr:hypothetical protein [Oscillospiraceae bacterium]